MMFVLQKLSPALSSPLYEELSDQIYYSEDEDDGLHADTLTCAPPLVHNSSDPNPQMDVHQDRTALLLSQLTSGNLPSQATIEMAVAQLMEALTAEEKQLMAQIVQQIAVMNPLLMAANPLALQVEAIRIILTTRSQRAPAMGEPALQQMVYQAQLPQTTVVATAAAQTTIMVTPTESCPVSVHHSAHPHVSRPKHDHLSSESASRVPEPKSNHTIALDTDAKYPDECSSASSGHVHLGAGAVSARGRGRGLLSSSRQFDDEMCQQERPRGRGLRRGRSTNSASGDASLPDNGLASVRQPLIPPVCRAAQPVHQGDSKGSPAVNISENWEEEIDEFGSEVFHVKSSFFKSGTR